ncbi:hypothetical protein J4462_02875 [Candidatus Pacearchaeota archaeon]|nr:hypothetical protein [Candidatus Pacearchaeota archaeon]
MEQKNITLEKVYLELRRLEGALREKGVLDEKDVKEIPETALLSEKALAETWLSKEDEKAFAYLQ